ncbi:TRAP transporter substrate-binding protein DctP [Georgenia sp. AZ-5]|uniref:TRAP transporter substrate-binding protein DctP n=1 Tax=Georgenia sp. AZ-5 TaxID=3367526 RepID=UPI0037543805
MRNKRLLRNRRAAIAISTLAVAGLTLSACGGSSGADDNGGDPAAGDTASVEPGASKEEYAEALANIDPVELSFQFPTAPGVATTAPAEKWAAAVEEWSDGKVAIELLYSGSRVPVHEMGQGLRDGLVDGGYLLQYTAPELFPIATYTGDLMPLHNPSPFVGTMQMVAQWVEFGNTQEALLEEARANNIEPLLWWLPGAGNGLFCTEPVSSAEDAAGKTIRTNSPLTTGLVKELGAATADVPTAEVYSALQRGVVDCAATALSVVDSMGLSEVAKHWTLDSKAQQPPAGGGLAINKTTWDDLPLPVRQLLWDRLDVYLESSFIDREFGVLFSALQSGLDAGVTIHEWDEETRKGQVAYMEASVAEAAGNAPEGVDGQQLVDAARESHEKWGDVIEELGFTEDVTWAEFAEWYADNKDDIDVTPLVDRLVEDVLAPNRPTA